MYRLAQSQFQDSSPPSKYELEAVVTEAGDGPGDRLGQSAVPTG